MRKSILIGIPVLLAGLGGLVAIAQTQKPVDAGAALREQKPIALPIPKGPETRPTGMAALRTSEGNLRAFSAEAMTAYFRTHNLPMNRGKTSDIHVDKVEMLADKDLALRLNGSTTGLGPDAKLAFVTLRGLFVFSGPPGGTPSRITRAYAVFDATSGNLVMVGSLGEGER